MAAPARAAEITTGSTKSQSHTRERGGSTRGCHRCSSEITTGRRGCHC
jgi:hypothetical protein